MKLHAHPNAHYNTVTAYGDAYVDINARRHDHSLVVLPEDVLEPWPVARFAVLTPEHFAALVAHRPEVVLFGSGNKLRFPHPRLTGALRAAGIGMETMDLQAACRTYNILMAEGRRVLAALLIESA